MPDRRAGAIVDHDQHRLAGLDRHIVGDDTMRRAGNLDGNRHLALLLLHLPRPALAPTERLLPLATRQRIIDHIKYLKTTLRMDRCRHPMSQGRASPPPRLQSASLLSRAVSACIVRAAPFAMRAGASNARWSCPTARAPSPARPLRAPGARAGSAAPIPCARSGIWRRGCRPGSGRRARAGRTR